MTLVLSVLTADYTVQLSDRRLTGRRQTLSDEANKAAVILSLTGRTVMGFSGLASLPSAGVDDVFADALAEMLHAAKPDYDINRMVDRFGGRMSEYFGTKAIRSLPPRHRATSFQVIGHLRTDPPHPVAYYISNFHDPANGLIADPPADEFRVSGGLVTGDRPTIVLPLGAHHHLRRSDIQPLLDLIDENRPPEAIVGKGVELVREWAAHSGAESLIGDQVSSVILPADQSIPGTAEYHTAVPQSTSYGIAEVRALPWDDYVVGGWEFTRLDGIGVVPKVGRNQPCPCQSGKKYKRCCGTRPSARPGQHITLSIEKIRDEPPPPSE